MKKIVSLLILSLTLNGCVSMKTYRDTKAEMLTLKYGHDQMVAQVETIRERNATLEDEYAQLLARLENANADEQVAALRAALAERDMVLSQIRSELSVAVGHLEGKGLTLTQRNGKIYVQMDDKLLFESGKYDITKAGKSAIRDISSVLAKTPNVDIIIEGHTDNKGLLKKKDSQIVDNWDLSCKRATEVVRVLAANTGVKQKRITASGRSQYSPVDDNTTENGRANNRRTEIILTPQLDKLIELLK